MELSDATLYVLDNAPRRFLLGKPMGPTELARHLYLDESTVRYHLHKLETAEYVQRRVIGRVKHLYVLVRSE